MAARKRESPSSWTEAKKPRLNGHGVKTERSTFVEDLESMTPVSTTASAWARKSLGPLDPHVDAMAFQWIDIDMYDGLPLQKNPKEGAAVPGVQFSGDARQSAAVIRLFGVTMDGNSVLMHVHGVLPYFTAFVQTISMRVDVETCDRTTTLFKIFLSMPSYVPKLRSVLEAGLTLPGCDFRNYQTYESNVPFILRFMIDEDVRGCNWVEAPHGTYSVRLSSQKMSLCQLEIDITYDNLVSHALEGRWSKVAPFRILSFDIECMGRKGHFPEAEQDPVIQIANVVQEQGSGTPIIRNVFVLDTCKPIVGAHVMEFEKEGDMLEKWANFVQDVDPDIITGYNIANFDIPAVHMEKKTFSSAQYGKSENVKTTIHGRCMFDLLPIMRRNQQLSSYSLNAVSAAFLGQQKEDVPHGIISDLQLGTDDDRHRLAVYCLKDAYLPLRLLDKLSYLVNHIEMARVSGVPIDFLIERGQQIKVFSMLLRKCKDASLVVPTLPRSQNSEDTGYEGATVIEPIKAFYTVPIATLDFASLYPSIMQAFNLCYSTLVAPGDADKLAPGDYQQSPSGDIFVTSKKKKGILPLILEEVLAARKQAKRDMDAATDPMEKAVQNGRQLALK
uniref:DNA polymerase delta catalytic subunit n=1 Tax=Hyaloperonospora arabidopsidis (strain Emoy2) TaxID=559515 RepID=M4C6L4_HYAAE